MLVSGLQKLSLLDYPGKVACVVFTPGCNLRCGFCHNPEFVLPEKLLSIKASFLEEREFFDFLKKRQGILDAVSICGGEPTMHQDLPDFCRRIKELGFLVKLDTNGSHPEILAHLLEKNLIDYVAMDVKHIWSKYQEITGRDIEISKYQESIKLIIDSAPDYEFRTTVIDGVHSQEDILEIASYIQGAKAYYLQNYRPGEVLDLSFVGSSFTEEKLVSIANEVNRK